MSMKKYEALVKTVELGSLTKAADALDSTQSRISHVLKDLEEGFGFPLLRRSRSGVELTEAGAMLFPMMQSILEQNKALEELAARHDPRVPGATSQGGTADAQRRLSRYGTLAEKR